MRIEKIKDSKGKKVEIYDEDNSVHYGLKRALMEREQLLAQKNLFTNPKELKKVVDQLDERISEIDQIISAIENDQ